MGRLDRTWYVFLLYCTLYTCHPFPFSYLDTYLLFSIYLLSSPFTGWFGTMARNTPWRPEPHSHHTRGIHRGTLMPHRRAFLISAVISALTGTPLVPRDNAHCDARLAEEQLTPNAVSTAASNKPHISRCRLRSLPCAVLGLAPRYPLPNSMAGPCT